MYKASPFVNLAVYLLIVWIGRQPALSRYVRFSFQQAIILDVALVRRVWIVSRCAGRILFSTLHVA